MSSSRISASPVVCIKLDFERIEIIGELALPPPSKAGSHHSPTSEEFQIARHLDRPSDERKSSSCSIRKVANPPIQQTAALRPPSKPAHEPCPDPLTPVVRLSPSRRSCAGVLREVVMAPDRLADAPISIGSFENSSAVPALFAFVLPGSGWETESCTRKRRRSSHGLNRRASTIAPVFSRVQVCPKKLLRPYRNTFFSQPIGRKPAGRGVYGTAI